MKRLLTTLMVMAFIMSSLFSQTTIAVYVVANQNTLFKQKIPAFTLIYQKDSLKTYSLDTVAPIGASLLTSKKTRIYPLAERGGFTILNEPNQLGLNMAGFQVTDGDVYWINAVAATVVDTASLMVFVDIPQNKRNSISIKRDNLSIKIGDNLAGSGDIQELAMRDELIKFQYKRNTRQNQMFINSDSIAFKTKDLFALVIDTSQTANFKNSVQIDNRLNVDNEARFQDSLVSLKGLRVIGTIMSSVGAFADNDATPDVAGHNLWYYNGTANSVTITDLDNPIVNAIYTIRGNSDTYTLTIADGGNFSLSGGINFTLGLNDVIVLWCVADNNYIEISRSDN
jgi:hypothetical protein